MIATLTARTAGPGIVPPLRWTVEEFHELRQQKRFLGRRAILLHGVILEQGPMNPPHAIAMELLTRIIMALPLEAKRPRFQLPLVLGLDSDPFPDLAIVPGDPRSANNVHPTTAEFVVEVSDTSLNTDLTEKAELYATARVPDYWVLDLAKRQLHILRDPAPLPAGLGVTAYRTHETFGLEESVAPLAFPGHPIRVADLLP